jgi:hypothetical protein
MTERARLVDGRVYRPAGWWTPTVHALLRYLHAVGFDRVPRPLGIEAGHEVLSWIAGDSGPAGWARVVPDDGLRAFARLLREYHEAVAGFAVPDDARWALCDGSPRPGQVICHGDFGPWNIVWDGLDPVGIVDFDFAGPGDPLDDVAYALEYSAPFRDDAQAIRWQGFTEPPDRARRVAVFAEAYGLATTDGLVDAVIRRQEVARSNLSTLAERGLEPQRTWVAEGMLDEVAARIRWSVEHRALFG